MKKKRKNKKARAQAENLAIARGRPNPFRNWTHSNRLMPFIYGVGMAIAQLLLALPLFIELQWEVQWIEEQAWLAFPYTVIVIGGVTLAVLSPVAHSRWCVTKELVCSIQSRPGSAIVRETENQGFVSLRVFGPVILVRKRSGATYLWPRGLRRHKVDYVFELRREKLHLRSVAS